MRPTSFFSAALCGILCTSSIPFANAQVKQRACHPGFEGATCSTAIECIARPEGCPPALSTAPQLPSTPTESPIAQSLAVPVDTSSTDNTATPAPAPVPVPAPTPTPTPAPVYTAPASDAPVASRSGKGAILGGVIGGLLGVALILGAVFLWRRRRRQGVAAASDFSALEKSLVSPPPTYPAPITAYSPPPPPPQLSQAPPITAVESHHLMGSYSSPSHQQQYGGGVVPIVGGPKYAANNERELDEDGVSLRSPSPVQDGGRAGERDSVPRLPIYNRGADNADRGPAL